MEQLFLQKRVPDYSITDAKLQRFFVATPWFYDLMLIELTDRELSLSRPLFHTHHRIVGRVEQKPKMDCFLGTTEVFECKRDEESVQLGSCISKTDNVRISHITDREVGGEARHKGRGGTIMLILRFSEPQDFFVLRGALHSARLVNELETPRVRFRSLGPVARRNLLREGQGREPGTHRATRNAADLGNFTIGKATLTEGYGLFVRFLFVVTTRI